MTTEITAESPLIVPAKLPSAGKWGSPGIVATLWVLATALSVLDQVRFPDYSDGSPFVSSILYLSAIPVIAALIAASIAGSRDRALPLAGSLLLLSCLTSLAWIAAEWAFEGSGIEREWVASPIVLVVIVGSAWLTVRTLRSDETKRARRWLATVAVVLILAVVPCISQLDDQLLAVSSEFASVSEAKEDFPEIDEERLWTSQPSLVESALAQVGQPSGTGAVYLVTVGASGSQDLFGREARVARTTLGRAFGAEKRSVLLANDGDSLFHAPLANNTNVDSMLSGLGRKADRSRDLFVLYLTSHGSRDAELTTDLPNYKRLQPIDAKRLAEALQRAGIRRRVVIVSACYAGSWIKPLATDDTIVVTAARADRTSFGCSDDRELTYFGEALLKGPLASGASLAESFKAARRSVTRWESDSKQRHSEPQAFVGRNMAAVWNARTADAGGVSTSPVK